MHSPVVASALALAFGSLLAAQERNPPANPLGEPVDAVIATVNDSAILYSTLRLLTNGRIKAHVEQYGSISRAESERIFREAQEDEIDRHRLAQSAKSLGPLPPEQVEQIVRGELDRDRQDQVRDLGSVNGLSQEMKRIGRTWPTYEKEQRIDKLGEIAEELAIGRRLSRQNNLFVTPRMLRATYELHRARFVRDAAAKVVQVRFTGPQAKANAEAAAQLWRQQPLDARQVAEKSADATAIAEVAASSLSAGLAAIAAFALQGPEGAVSDPVPLDDAFFVARVTAHLPASNGQFEDAAVQEQLRNLCFQQVWREFRAQAMERARQRTEVWRLQGNR